MTAHRAAQSFVRDRARTQLLFINILSWCSYAFCALAYVTVHDAISTLALCLVWLLKLVAASPWRCSLSRLPGRHSKKHQASANRESNVQQPSPSKPSPWPPTNTNATGTTAGCVCREGCRRVRRRIINIPENCRICDRLVYYSTSGMDSHSCKLEIETRTVHRCPRCRQFTRFTRARAYMHKCRHAHLSAWSHPDQRDDVLTLSHSKSRRRRHHLEQHACAGQVHHYRCERAVSDLEVAVTEAETPPTSAVAVTKQQQQRSRHIQTHRVWMT